MNTPASSTGPACSTGPQWEIAFERGTARSWLVMLALALGSLLVAGLMLLGRTYTPTPATWLSLADWQALKVERAYQAELADLRQSATELAAALQVAPDPVRLGLLRDRLTQRHAKGLPALTAQRAAVLSAADALYQWAIGLAPYDQAAQMVQAALDALQ